MDYPPRMELFHKILKTAVDGGASDIHIKIGTPVIFRINRELISIECPVPTEQWMNNVVEKITPMHLKKKLEEDREVDFSYYRSGRGPVPHQSFPAARPMGTGDAPRQKSRCQL